MHTAMYIQTYAYSIVHTNLCTHAKQSCNKGALLMPAPVAAHKQAVCSARCIPGYYTYSHEN